MAKSAGLGMRLFVAGYDFSGDIGSFTTIRGGPAALECTGIDKSAYERFGGKRDSEVGFTAWFNDASAQSHPRLSLLPTSAIHVMGTIGSSIGSPGFAQISRQVNYDPTRPEDGSWSSTVQCLGDGYGLEWGEQLTANKRTDTAATNGSSLDGTAGTTEGMQAYLQVFSFTGTSCTVKIQSSSDDGAGDAFADVTGLTFTAATGITTERIATAAGASIERYLRVVTTGTFSECTFIVLVVRNKTAVTF